MLNRPHGSLIYEIYYMITSLFLRHFKIYKGINFIPLSEGYGFSSLIGENGAGKSSVLEALDCAFNKRNTKDWPINNEAKYEGGLGGANAPYISPVFLIKKDKLKVKKIDDQKPFEIAERLSSFLWTTNVKTKSKSLEEFYKHRDELKLAYDPEKYCLIVIGRRFNENGIFFGSFQNAVDFVRSNPQIKATDSELEVYFFGF